MAASISGSSHWASAQSVMCICVLSLIDSTLTSMESALRWVVESTLYSNSALLPAPEIIEDSFHCFRGHGMGDSLFRSSVLLLLFEDFENHISQDHGDCFEHLFGFFIRENVSLILLKASAIVLFSREKSYFASSFIHLFCGIYVG